MLINDHFSNFKVYQLPKAQLIIADIPYNVGKNAYGSNPSWYIDGDNKNGQSELAGKQFFDTDANFKPAEFMHFCTKMLKKEPKERGKDAKYFVKGIHQHLKTRRDSTYTHVRTQQAAWAPGLNV